jgi:hypothetical protein
VIYQHEQSFIRHGVYRLQQQQQKQQKSPMTLNQKVVVWAQGHLGKKVGAGECWDLGESALKQAGAQTSNVLGPVGDDTDYIWGDQIDMKDVQPGDIIQIRDHEVTTTTETEYTFSDGTSINDTKSSVAQRGHHTAIANGKLDADGSLKNLEQHVKPLGEKVQNKTLFTRDVSPLVKKKFEKKLNPTTHKTETVEVTTTVTVTVTGKTWVYRPKPK